jgi:hypothetical protein
MLKNDSKSAIKSKKSRKMHLLLLLDPLVVAQSVFGDEFGFISRLLVQVQHGSLLFGRHLYRQTSREGSLAQLAAREIPINFYAIDLRTMMRILKTLEIDLIVNYEKEASSLTPSDSPREDICIFNALYN